MKLVTAEQMREMDRQAIEDYGIEGLVLMENAGRGAAAVLQRRYADRYPGPLLILCGKGNNGGDGYVMARHLQAWGWQVRLLALAAPQRLRGAAGHNAAIASRCGLPLLVAEDEAALARLLQQQNDCRLLVDAIFGNGMTAPARGHYRQALHWLNASGVPVFAVDMPSGIDATSGAVLEEAVQADCSASFACAKIGQVSMPAAAYGGALEVVDIGMPAVLQAAVPARLCLVEAADARALLPRRTSDSHKGVCGHSLLLAGMSGTCGAARLCAEGALRGGSGLVTLAAPAVAQAQLTALAAEVMTFTVPASKDWEPFDGDQLSGLLAGKNAVAVGPGIGWTPASGLLLKRLLGCCHVPLVVDADGLNVLSQRPELLQGSRPAALVLTPHPGEMARLTGLTVAQIQQDRCGVASAFARRHQLVLVLKGARTVIAAADGRVWLNGTGNAGMASGGMGDVLTGLVAALLAQGLAPFEAAVLAVYLHGAAADICATTGAVGYGAMAVARALPQARQNLQTAGIPRPEGGS
ncbi:MAG: NAD(P)H-hydrate dehydratase [Desulfuromonas thiophila]|nr:NAD(P)H-hydrate dehydratase [Desulfuromonas thiophila]